MKQIHLALLAPMLLLAACSSVRDSDRDAAAATGGGYSTPFPGAGAGTGTAGVESAPLSNLSPQQQLAQIGDRIFFGVDQHEVSAESAAILDAQAGFLRNNPAVTLTLEGHADERGTREYNLALGQKRAEAVRRYLTAAGIDNNRLQTLSFGKERPAVAGSGPDAWDQNRRVVSVVN